MALLPSTHTSPAVLLPLLWLLLGGGGGGPSLSSARASTEVVARFTQAGPLGLAFKKREVPLTLRKVNPGTEAAAIATASRLRPGLQVRQPAQQRTHSARGEGVGVEDCG
jgi:hypothetical protein